MSALGITLIAKHVIYCNAVSKDIASIKTLLEAIRVEIGTHETGIRGQLHVHQGALIKLDARVNSLERK